MLENQNISSSFYRTPAKVLLFGEYTILSGSKALAIPYPHMYGKLTFDDADCSEALISRQHLEKFLRDASLEDLDADLLREDFSQGLWFKSSIPQGHGVGSSGALIAALYLSYRKNMTSNSLSEHRVALSKLENYFHGSSSGLDPLVSFTHKSLLIHQVDQVEIIEKTLDLKHLFLLNTQIARQTSPLVQIYRQKMQDEKFEKKCRDFLSILVNQAIEQLIHGRSQIGDQQSFFECFWQISQFQYENFFEMIPLGLQELWKEGLEKKEFVLKLCGAGGGGLLLGLKAPTANNLVCQFPTISLEAGEN